MKGKRLTLKCAWMSYDSRRLFVHESIVVNVVLKALLIGYLEIHVGYQ